MKGWETLIYILRITRNHFRDATVLNSESAKRLHHPSDYPLPLDASCVTNTQKHFVSSQKMLFERPHALDLYNPAWLY